MRIDRVVADASPLIILFKSGLINLLPQLFNEIVVTATVRQEVAAGGTADPAATGLARAAWAVSIADPVIPPVISAWDLDSGEATVLAQAQQMPGARALVDDRAARNCAKTLQIPVLGTVGVIVLAKRRGLIDSARNALAKIAGAGCWLSADLIQTTLEQAGEY